MLLAGLLLAGSAEQLHAAGYGIYAAYPFPLEHQTGAIEYGYVVSGLYHITDDLDAGLVYPSHVREDSGGTSSGWPNHACGMDARVTLPDWLEGGLNDTLTESSQSEAMHATL